MPILALLFFLGLVIAIIGFAVFVIGFLARSSAVAENQSVQGVPTFGALIFVAGALLCLLAFFSMPQARAADLPLPPEITVGRSVQYDFGPALGTFGTYSDPYLRRRWQRMCATAARYQAMAEAYDHGKQNPCTTE